jgi:2-polyprenyl-6-methoxyphenol hydroxylase-like FAD-dependent oxidoreductase
MPADEALNAVKSPRHRPSNVLIVGGSLVGLATGIRLARSGLIVTVVERGTGFGAEGAGLGIDRQRLSNVTGVSAIDGRDAPPLPVIVSSRESTSWSALYRWLRMIADRHQNLEIRTGRAVTGFAAQNGCAHVAIGDEWVEADLVFGADGRGSIVRRAIAPDRPIARYAGYGLWRGMIEEAALPKGTLPAVSPPVGVMWASGQRLVAYGIPGPQGSTVPGGRAVNWGWYDPDLTQLFTSAGCVRGEEVIRSLRPEELDADLEKRLSARANLLWPEPWRTAILATITAKKVFATPIAEYLPVRLVAGPLALIGDAAHLASPMTGAGLITGLDDVAALGRAIDRDLAGGPPALAAYEAARLAPAQALATSSILWSRDYVEQAGQDSRS